MKRTEIEIMFFSFAMIIIWSLIAVSAVNLPMKAIAITASILFGSLLFTLYVFKTRNIH